MGSGCERPSIAFRSAAPASFMAMSSFLLGSSAERSVMERVIDDAEFMVLRLVCPCPLFLTLPCLRSCMAAAYAAFEGVARIEADEFDRGKCRPSRFSNGGSNLATLHCLSDVLEAENEPFMLGSCVLLSESESESESSHRLG